MSTPFDGAGAIPGALLCPVRVRDDVLEVLMTRRAFWNHQKDRPMRYPGEWVFPGGSREEGDVGLLETAIREFREELHYDGEVKGTRRLRAATQDSHGRTYYSEFYAAKVDSAFPFMPHEGDEVIDVKWLRPADALGLIRSGEFTTEQLGEFRERGLGDSRFGIYAVNERQFPIQNVLTLELIQSMPELREEYR
ncbi:MAG: NUDIX domain-containing protein [Planctomycetota bacterium]|jgi:8-oxo-dGTP pyrophosphatase MutT (NUDIX family)